MLFYRRRSSLRRDAAILDTLPTHFHNTPYMDDGPSGSAVGRSPLPPSSTPPPYGPDTPVHNSHYPATPGLGDDPSDVTGDKSNTEVDGYGGEYVSNDVSMPVMYGMVSQAQPHKRYAAEASGSLGLPPIGE